MNFNIFVFSISLFIGLFFVYIYAPEPKIIIKTPNLKNIKKTTYIDESNNCYRYKAKEIKCPV